jgi:hypothetical protein
MSRRIKIYFFDVLKQELRITKIYFSKITI